MYSGPGEDLYEAYGLVFEDDSLNPDHITPEIKAGAKGPMVEDESGYTGAQTEIEDDDKYDQVFLFSWGS